MDAILPEIAGRAKPGKRLRLMNTEDRDAAPALPV
jgi:hypothetical protein